MRLWSKQMGRTLNGPTPLHAPVWFVAAFIPMVTSQVLRLSHLDAGGWLFWDYAGRLGGLAVLAATVWPVAFRREKLRMAWMQVAVCVLVIVLLDNSLGGWIRTTGNRLFPSTVLGHYPVSIGRLHWFDIAFGLGLDTYTEEVVFRRSARHVFKPYLGDGWLLVLVTSLIFGAYHWWSGVGNILAAMLMGVLFMLFYQRSGSLWPVVLSHYLTDVAHFA